MNAHPDYDRIARSLEQHKTRAAPWSGVIYRSTSPRHFSRDGVLSGMGSFRRGGRWNPAGVKAVYGSLTPETAMAETLQHYRYYSIPIPDAMPKVFVAVRVSVQRCLDLGDTATLAALGLGAAELLAEDWRAHNQAGQEALTQAIGRAVAAAGLEALLAASSAEKGGMNLVVYPDALATTSSIGALGV